MNNNKLLILGFIGISVASALSFIFNNLWIGYFSSMVVGIIILVFMTKNMRNVIQDPGMKKTMIYLFSALVISQGYTSIIDWNKVKFQKDTLREIRLTIDDSIGKTESESLLVKTLRAFYLSESDSTLEAHFREVAEDRLEVNGQLKVERMEQENDLKFYYEIADSDSILIHVVSEVARGYDLKFDNRNENTGKYEAVATLTEKGVRYVRQN